MDRPQPIEMPAEDAPAEAWVVFLKHQLAAERWLTRTRMETEKEIAERIEATYKPVVDSLKKRIRQLEMQIQGQSGPATLPVIALVGCDPYPEVKLA